MTVPVHVALETTFEVIPNGGSGDCAYLAIAMAQADKDGCDLTAERFALGGTKQRNLRGMVAKEIMKNPACYPKARLKEALSMAGKDPEFYVCACRWTESRRMAPSCRPWRRSTTASSAFGKSPIKRGRATCGLAAPSVHHQASCRGSYQGGTLRGVAPVEEQAL